METPSPPPLKMGSCGPDLDPVNRGCSTVLSTSGQCFHPDIREFRIIDWEAVLIRVDFILLLSRG
jgi:hypothetical protein